MLLIYPQYLLCTTHWAGYPTRRKTRPSRLKPSRNHRWKHIFLKLPSVQTTYLSIITSLFNLVCSLCVKLSLMELAIVGCGRLTEPCVKLQSVTLNFDFVEAWISWAQSSVLAHRSQSSLGDSFFFVFLNLTRQPSSSLWQVLLYQQLFPNLSPLVSCLCCLSWSPGLIPLPKTRRLALESPTCYPWQHKQIREGSNPVYMFFFYF